MYATLDFWRRHKRKIVAGTAAVAATVYAAKCVLESRTVNQFVQQYLQHASVEEPMSLDDGCLDEARRHFIFDVHQQSCDKALNSLVIQLRSRIDTRFNTEELLAELRSGEELTAHRKIEIWEQLKVRSVAKIISVFTIFPLVTLVLKIQKSMVCQHVYQSLPQKKKQPSSLYEHGIHYVSSLFYSESDRQSEATKNTAKAQKLFNESVQFLLTDGIDLLCGILEQIASDIFSPIQLSEQLGTMDLHFLFERARARVKAIGSVNNFSDFIIPTTQLNLPIAQRDGEQLKNLLKHFILILQTQRCRKLMDDFGGQYLEAVLQYLDEIAPEGKTLPLAKLIPRLGNVIPHITANNYTSVFYATLTSTELHQFILFVSQCSNFSTEGFDENF